MPNPYGQFVPDPLAPSGYRWQRHGEQPATTMLPIVPPSPIPRDEPATGDVGDWIDPNAPDPTPDEITDPEHPDYVEPWTPE